MGSDTIYLSYGTYRRLDTITRIEVGRPLCVFDPSMMPHEMGTFHGFSVKPKIKVTRIPSAGGYVEKDISCLPHIANRIELENWKNPNVPNCWLDYSKVPRDLVYDFLVYHEIAHIKHGDSALADALVEKGVFTAEQYNNNEGDGGYYKALMEYRADKYAWGKIMAGKDMPLPEMPKEAQAAAKTVMRNILNLCRIHDNDLEAVKVKRVEPISLNADEYVPLLHAECGGPPLVEAQQAAKVRAPLTQIMLESSKTPKGKAALSLVGGGLTLITLGALWLQPFVCLTGAVLLPLGVRLLVAVQRRLSRG